MANFVKHTSCEHCGSSDGLAIYDDDSEYCFVCEYTKSTKGRSSKTKVNKTKEKQEVVLSNKEPISEEKKKEIKNSTSFVDYRGVRKDVSKLFGVRCSLDEFGEVLEQYTPCTINGELVGYHVREVPKTFYTVGQNGAECELFGQFRFKKGGKYVLITEGQIDAMSAYQMLDDYTKSRGSDFEIAVVSVTTGAGSHKQIANNYSFLDMFDNVVLCLDNDDAGEKAKEKIVKVLPKGKVKIMQMRMKDANKYLLEGEAKAFVRDFYDAKTYVPVGVVGSNQISAAMREELKIEKIPLPAFMRELQKMMAGGIPLGRILNIGSASGTGKSTIIDEMIYYWLFHSPHMIGVVTLESTVGQYGIKLLSRHISKKIELLDQDVAMELVESEEVKQKEHELFNDEDNKPRFYLVDDRDGGVSNIQDAIENLIISCDCKVIICDPISDVIAALPNEEQEHFMSWQKGMVKSHGVTFINICHTRKTGNGQKSGSTGADLHEEDIIGSSSIYKSAACNLMFMRDKEAEDEIERNTTIMKATKIRWTGKTGIAGKYYYDCDTHTLHDLDDFLNSRLESEFK